LKPISSRYSRIFATYYWEKARSRFDFIQSYSSFFLEGIAFKEKLHCYVDTVKTDAFITSYFLDVIKFKEYHFQPSSEDEDEKVIHGEKMLNHSKVASFTAKWLLKYCPIVMVPKEGVTLDLFERRLLQNAPFILALNVALRAMDIRPDTVPLDIYKSIVYHLRFREYDDRSLILYFELLKKYVDLSKSSSGGAV
jgi:hypothetical protein